MAQAQPGIGKTPKQNHNPEEEFSFIQPQTGSAESILRNTSWPTQDDSLSATNESTRPTFSAENLDSCQIFASHYALATAYARVTKKLADAEQRNRILQFQDNLRNHENFIRRKMSGSASSQNNFGIPFNIEASVNQAWEAYNEKCKECQHLRDELEEVKQRSQNTEHFSQIQDLKEDVLREKAKQDDVVRKLEKSKMEADHLGKKEVLAREELEKEREYQRSLIQAAEKKHRELEQKIEVLEMGLSAEKSLNSDLIKREKDHQKAVEEEFVCREKEYISKVRKLEEKVISLQEEVSVLVSIQSSMTGQGNGPCTSNAQHNGSMDMSNDCISTDSDSKIDAMQLCTEMQSLRGELNDLKTRAAEQSHILCALFQNPKIIHLLRSIDQLQANRAEYSSMQDPTPAANGQVGTPVQCSEEPLSKQKRSNALRSSNAYLSQSMVNNLQTNDVRQVIGSSLPKDLYGAGCTKQEQAKYLQQTNTQSSGSTVVLKSTEEFIRDISKFRPQERRAGGKLPSRNESFEYNPLFPPMDVSRVIHVPKKPDVPDVVERMSPTYTGESKNYNPYPAGVVAGGGMQYHNGNMSTYTRPSLNHQGAYFNAQDEGFARDDPFSIPSASSSSSINDTLVVTSTVTKGPVRTTNPFYRDMGAGVDPKVPTNIVTGSARLVDSNAAKNLSRDMERTSKTLNMNTSSTRNLMDVDHENYEPSRPPQPAFQSAGDASFATPSNRYLSSGEDNEDDSFDRTIINDATQHQPKEFVVPKVVHASALGLGQLGQTQNKKAFLDGRLASPGPQTDIPPSRPSMRAKPEQTSLNLIGKRQENRPNNSGLALSYEYSAESSKGPKRNDVAIKTCPICNISFGLGSSQESMNRHINAHFSDEEDLLSFD